MAVMMRPDGVTDASFTLHLSSGFWPVCYVQIIFLTNVGIAALTVLTWKLYDKSVTEIFRFYV